MSIHRILALLNEKEALKKGEGPNKVLPVFFDLDLKNQIGEAIFLGSSANISLYKAQWISGDAAPPSVTPGGFAVQGLHGNESKVQLLKIWKSNAEMPPFENIDSGVNDRYELGYIITWTTKEFSPWKTLPLAKGDYHEDGKVVLSDNKIIVGGQFADDLADSGFEAWSVKACDV
jgi:hypothetical protein